MLSHYGLDSAKTQNTADMTNVILRVTSSSSSSPIIFAQSSNALTVKFLPVILSGIPPTVMTVSNISLFTNYRKAELFISVIGKAFQLNERIQITFNINTSCEVFKGDSNNSNYTSHRSTEVISTYMQTTNSSSTFTIVFDKANLTN